ncbi:hypothetical protein OUZ56_022415 [Daphnia magna]|uniref:Transmembrane protein n=1 Tax=Daphnia magna TaxID=35525 RepID=A0ABR0AWG2_9CRUS|nr:hypothetical protein OUZ56_022415 [Daphnia magna]
MNKLTISFTNYVVFIYFALQILFGYSRRHNEDKRMSKRRMDHSTCFSMDSTSPPNSVNFFVRLVVRLFARMMTLHNNSSSHRRKGLLLTSFKQSQQKTLAPTVKERGQKKTLEHVHCVGEVGEGRRVMCSSESIESSTAELEGAIALRATRNKDQR